ncbi:MAG: AarF/UbiB family protein [Microbacterium sp.]
MTAATSAVGPATPAADTRARTRRILRFATRALLSTWWFDLVLPPEITAELAGLQDEVPAASSDRVRQLAEAELGMPLARAYVWFDESPVAAASLGQAHRARLAVSLARTCREEIDYLHEAANAERFAAQFAGDPRVATSAVEWERTTRRVLTLSDVTAIEANDVEALRRAGIDPAEVASAFARIMFEQLFTHGFFHADPHPGNVFVMPGADRWRITFVDFGMMGEVQGRLRAGLVAGIGEIGVLLPSADTAELERAMTRLFARFGGMGFAQLREVDPREFRDFAEEFGDVIRELPFQLPEDFLLIVRAISLTSGLCSALDPRFNVWSAVEPFAAELLRDQGRHAVRDVVSQAAAAAGVAWRLPQRIDAVITRIEDGRMTVDLSAMERRLAHLERFAARILGAVLFAALLVAGVLLLPVSAAFGGVLVAVSSLPLLYALLPRGR